MTGRRYLFVPMLTTTTTTSHRHYTSVAFAFAVVVVGDCDCDKYGGAAGQKICDDDSIVDVMMIVCCCELPLGHRDVRLAMPKLRPEQYVDDTVPVEAAADVADLE